MKLLQAPVSHQRTLLRSDHWNFSLDTWLLVTFGNFWLFATNLAHRWELTWGRIPAWASQGQEATKGPSKLFCTRNGSSSDMFLTTANREKHLRLVVKPHANSGNPLREKWTKEVATYRGKRWESPVLNLNQNLRSLSCHEILLAARVSM